MKDNLLSNDPERRRQGARLIIICCMRLLRSIPMADLRIGRVDWFDSVLSHMKRVAKTLLPLCLADTV